MVYQPPPDQPRPQVGGFNPGQQPHPGPAPDPRRSPETGQPPYHGEWAPPVPWGSPVQPGYPTVPWAYPPGAYPPGYGYWQSGPGYVDPNDPLVTPPGAGVNGWFVRAQRAVARSWRSLLPIMLITQAVPAFVLGLAMLPVTQDITTTTVEPGDPAQINVMLKQLLAVLGFVLVVGVLTSLVQSLGWAAGTWAVTRQALGQQVRLGAALRYGLRRALGLWAWTLLSTLIITAGMCACLLPGIYFAFALSLAGPVFLFERSNPIGRSFRMFHARLGLVLGRVALVAAVPIAGAVAVRLVQDLGMLAVGAGPGSGVGLSVGAVAVTAVTALLNLPISVAQLVGLVVTYAEQRGWEAPVRTAQLATELG